MVSDPFVVFDEPDDDTWDEDEPAPPPMHIVPNPGSVTHVPTWYRGKLYRSRTETRWAIFFDQVAIPYQHEEQPYGVDGEGFLPDFRIPDRLLDVEIKRDKFPIDLITSKRFQTYALGVKRFLLVMSGWPDRSSSQTDEWPGVLYFDESEWHDKATWAECLSCHSVGVLSDPAGRHSRDVWRVTSRCSCRPANIALVGPRINEAIAFLIAYDFDRSR